MSEWKDASTEKYEELHKLAENDGAEYICPGCKGFGELRVRNRSLDDSRGFGYSGTVTCKVCGGDGSITLRKITRPPEPAEEPAA